MPQMGYDMLEGTVVRWLMTEGSEVNIGDALAEIETDKAVVEFEATEPGLLRKILVAEGATVPVGQVIAIVGDADEDISALEAGDASPAPAPEPAPAEEVPEEEPAIPLPPSAAAADTEAPTTGGFRASPVARRLADERGIDLRQVQGTGPGGRITKGDVLAFEPGDAPAVVPEEPAEEPSAPAEPTKPVATPPEAAGELVPMSRVRQQIARVTAKSKREAPHFYVSAEIDMTKAMDLRKQINATLESEGVRVSVNDMIIRACAEALNGFPNLNSYYTDDGIQMNDGINIGIAIAGEQGLILPAIMESGTMSLAEIAKASKDLVDRATKGTLHTREYTGGTFAVSNLGMFDVTSFIAIIQPPQSAMLAVGTVAPRPIADGGEIKVASMMTATISADHRVTDGAESAQFLVAVKKMLEDPMSLLV
ncbi:MAG: dihydrolipoamide acetyltransferase family protein [SAR202 cluster bacterium]|jgi:pyruvate dehydrogenase E2 component (dihydrolipoamide acetyltransferase)|nr:dihydrolipoamide acetyltransferase family protein [SAR202 cluster bacterium]